MRSINKACQTGALLRVLCKAVILTVIVLPTLGAPSSKPRVKLTGYLNYESARPGQKMRAIFEVVLPLGYHVNSNMPLDEFLKPTRLLLSTPRGVNVDEIVYPEPSLFKTRFSEGPIMVYEQQFVIGAFINLASDLELGEHRLSASLKYQACTVTLCYPPATRTTEITLMVSENSNPSKSSQTGMFEAAPFGFAPDR